MKQNVQLNHNISKSWTRLKNFIKQNALYITEEPFTLSSGKQSHVYFDFRNISLDPLGFDMVGHLIFNMIKHTKVDSIGGLELGSVPIASSVISAGINNNTSINQFIVRKNQKSHGTQKKIEGNLGKNIVIVDDVLTTGSSIITCLDGLQDFDINIQSIIVVIDRQEGGIENIEDKYPNISITPLYRKNQFVQQK